MFIGGQVNRSVKNNSENQAEEEMSKIMKNILLKQVYNLSINIDFFFTRT
jgi:hypothetical protein